MKTNYARFLKRTTAFVPAALLATVVSHANPLDGQVVAGNATITTPNPTTELINQQSNSAIINWKAFDIGFGETTQFILPDSTGVTLNRVVGGQDPSKILGTLKSNGTVMVVNPDGILFGPNSRVDVGGLLATTSDISDKDFMAKNYQFTKPGKSTASIVNQGMITVKDEGIAALVAPGVRNEGVISARLGKVTLGAANKFTLDFYGDDLIKLMLDDTLEGDVISTVTGKPLADKVANAGTIKADGGIVVLKAATARKVVNSVINNTGVIEANSVGLKNGKIILSAVTAETKVASTTEVTAPTPKQIVKVSGTLSASGKKPKQHGGMIAITGEELQLIAANLIASGDLGGGTILVGGDYLGGKASDQLMASYGIKREATLVPTATNVIVDSNTTINADATGTGNGGKVVVWSDGVTATGGTISARGGAVSGDGGFIETSGKYLYVDKAADASAPNGKAGTWLLDPLDVHIANTASANFGTVVGPYLGDTYTLAYPTGNPSVISTSVVNAAINGGSNVALSTRGTVGGAPGNIYIDNSITKTAGGNVKMIVDSANDVIFAPGVNITSTSGAMFIDVIASQGRIFGNNVGLIKTFGGQLTFEATDGVDFHSNYDMPNIFQLKVNNYGPSSLSTVNFDISFDQDIIKFSHNNTTATFPTGGIQLVDATTVGQARLNLYGLNAALEDKSVLIKYNRAWSATVEAGKAFGATTAAALNGVPEIVSDSFVNVYPTTFGVPGIAPVWEIDATNPHNCFALTCVATGPEGKARINNYLHPQPQSGAKVATSVPSKTQTQSLISSVDPNKLDAFSRDVLAAYGNSTASFDLISSNADYAMMADASYAEGGIKVPNWKIVDIHFASDNDPLSVTVFQNSNLEVVIAFRGTVGAPPLSPDWQVDAELSYSNLSKIPRFVAALDYAKAVVASLKATNVTVTGHSLGGGLAQYVGAELKAKVVAFDPAPIGKAASKENNSTVLNYSNILNFRGYADPVSKLPGELSSKTVDVKNVYSTSQSDSVKAAVFTDAGYINHSMNSLSVAMQAVRLVQKRLSKLVAAN